MLSYVSAFAGHGRQAVRLAEAAAGECGRGDPVLRARKVQSPRGRGYLRSLRSAMTRRTRSPLVRDLLEEFDKASSAV